ncbi:MAG: hypothetical protein OXI12_10200, partial [Gammaproteobacteria bacterium]|nr:hypothetical protein [Gammaproteobacteria bacterium]
NPEAGVRVTAVPQLGAGDLGRTADAIVLPPTEEATSGDDGLATLNLWPYSDWRPAGVVYEVTWSRQVTVGEATVGTRSRSMLVGVLDEDGLWLHDPRLQVQPGVPFGTSPNTEGAPEPYLTNVRPTNLVGLADLEEEDVGKAITVGDNQFGVADAPAPDGDGGNVPAGGDRDDLLSKRSPADYDTVWVSAARVTAPVTKQVEFAEDRLSRLHDLTADLIAGDPIGAWANAAATTAAAVTISSQAAWTLDTVTALADFWWQASWQVDAGGVRYLAFRLPVATNPELARFSLQSAGAEVYHQTINHLTRLGSDDTYQYWTEAIVDPGAQLTVQTQVSTDTDALGTSTYGGRLATNQVLAALAAATDEQLTAFATSLAGHVINTGSDSVEVTSGSTARIPLTTAPALWINGVVHEDDNGISIPLDGPGLVAGRLYAERGTGSGTLRCDLDQGRLRVRGLPTNDLPLTVTVDYTWVPQGSA